MIQTRAYAAIGYKALAILFLAAVALAILALSAPASAAGAAKTTLTIRAQGLDLSGTVQSSRGSCLGDRNIKLYKQQGQEQRPNTDPLIATDTSERQGNRGEWSTGNTGMRG
ncbi:MAG: hypothetical protein H0T91_07415, partial [Propionibacteriaceae bacterium]|nr:hypothetical protein [Propionibacteriaceae bacterium]